MAWWFSNFFFAYFAKYIPDESFNSGGAISYINSSDQIVAHGLKSEKNQHETILEINFTLIEIRFMKFGQL